MLFLFVHPRIDHSLTSWYVHPPFCFYVGGLIHLFFTVFLNPSLSAFGDWPFRQCVRHVEFSYVPLNRTTLLSKLSITSLALPTSSNFKYVKHITRTRFDMNDVPLCVLSVCFTSASQTLVTRSTSRLLVHHSNIETVWIVHIMLSLKYIVGNIISFFLVCIYCLHGWSPKEWISSSNHSLYLRFFFAFIITCSLVPSCCQ